MTELFLNIVNMSIAAGWIVLAVLLLRPFLKKAPRWVSVLLWGIVGVRLVCPVVIESPASLIPSGVVISPSITTDEIPKIKTGIGSFNRAVNPILLDIADNASKSGTNIFENIIPILSVIWLIGVASLLMYAILSYSVIRHRTRDAVPLSGNIYLSDKVSSPFVFGLIRPRIYLPLYTPEDAATHIIAHEKAHIARRDHLWKPLGFLILAIHWFNPLVVVAYTMLSGDIELACDERVIKKLGLPERADYSETLLKCSVNRRSITACPLAFGEVSVKKRVRSVLSYKQPAIWLIAVSLVASTTLAVCFLTNPENDIPNVELTRRASSLDGFSLELASLDQSASSPSLTVRFNNNTDADVIFDSEFDIYRLEDDTWIDCRADTRRENSASAQKIRSGDKNEYTFALGSHIMSNPGKYKLEAQFSLENRPNTRYYGLIEFKLNEGITAHSALTLDLSTLVYCGGTRQTSAIDVERMPMFRIVDGTLLQSVRDGVASTVGELTQISLDGATFDSRVDESGWSDGYSAAVLKADNRRAWQQSVTDPMKLEDVYLLLEQNDGTYYIAVAYYTAAQNSSEYPMITAVYAADVVASE